MLIDSETLKNAILSIMPERSEVLLVVNAQPEGIVRCKDCKHKPVFERKDNYGNWYKFPDDICPCQNGSDDYYSYCPEDDWFCADGERKEGDGDGT